jgi:hypothetical protein
MHASPQTSERERGLALPMAIFATALLTSMIVGALMLVSTERRATDSQAATIRTATVAQTGLNQFILTRTTTFGFTASPPAAYESTRVALADGYADVVLQRIRAAGDGQSAVYVVRSTGVDTNARLVGVPQATRTVAQYVRWVVGSMRVLSGWTSLTGLTKNGAAGTLSGYDACGDSAAKAGVAVPTTPGYSQNGNPPVPSGDPGILNMGTQEEMAAMIGIDWNGIVNGGAVTPTYTIPPDGWPSFPTGSWPVIYVNQSSFSLPGSGRGTLIVRGDLTISGARTWEGIILVGGTLTSNGNNTVLGAAVSGLNVLLGETVGTSDVGNGTKTYQYDSCNVASALANMTGLQAVPNAWVDNWPSY